MRTVYPVPQPKPYVADQPRSFVGYADFPLPGVITMPGYVTPGLKKLSVSITAGVEQTPYPLLYKSLANDPPQLSMKAYARLAYVDPILQIVDPLNTRRIIAFDPTQKLMQPDSILIPVEATTPKSTYVIANNPFQKLMQAIAILASVDAPPDPLLDRKITAHDPVQKQMQPDSILATVDASPYPLEYSVIANDPPQKKMQPYSLLAYADPPPPAQLDPLFTRRVVAHSPLQKLQQVYSVLASIDNPVPESHKVIANDPAQKIMQAYSSWAYADAPVPISTFTRAHSPVQAIMQVLSILASVEQTPYPLGRRNIAHDPIQKLMQAYNYTATDLVPDPLIRRVTAFETVQKIMRPYTLLSYTDFVAPVQLDPLLARRVLTLGYDGAKLKDRDSFPIYYLGMTFLDPLLDRRVIANEPPQRVPASLTIYGVPDLIPDPLITQSEAFSVIQKIMKPYALLAYTDFVAPAVLDPLRVRRVIANDPLQNVMETLSLIAPVEGAVPKTTYVQAQSPVQKLMQALAILVTADSTPDPLVDRRVIANDPVQKVMQAYSLLASVDAGPIFTSTKAHSPTHKQMQPYDVIGSVDAGPIFTSAQANNPLQKLMQAISIYPPFAEQTPYPLGIKMPTHNPVQAVMQVLSILGATDRPPDPLLRKATAFDLTQKQMQPYALLAYTDFVAPAILDPLRVRRVTAIDPLQKIMQPLSLVASVDASVPQTTYSRAYTTIQKLMQAIAITILTPDAAPDPLRGRRVTAHDPVQKLQQAYSLLAYSDIAPDPLSTRRVVAFDVTQKQMLAGSIVITPDASPVYATYAHAHDPLQKLMRVLSVLISPDYIPDPLNTRRAIAFDIPQKLMQPYTKLAYADVIIAATLDPLLTRRTIGNDPRVIVPPPYSLLATIEQTPYPLVYRLKTHDPIQKQMQPYFLLANLERIPYPLYIKLKTHDPIQKQMQAYAFQGSRDLKPDPLLTRLITAHSVQQKFLLSRGIAPPYPVALILDKFTGHVLGRMWVGHAGSVWDARAFEAWKAVEGTAWEGRYFRRWKR